MLKSRLIQVLRTFSKKEFRELNKWVNSPFHNQRADVIALYNYLMNANHLFDDGLLNKVLIFNKIYPNEKFDDSRMRQVMHFMFKEVEKFLIYEEFIKQKIGNKILLTKIYRRKKLPKLFLKEVAQTKDLQQNTTIRNDLFYYDSYILEHEIYNFTSESQRVSNHNLQEVSDALDTSFIISKLRQNCLMLAHKAVYKVEYKQTFLNEIITFIEDNNLLELKTVSIYYYLYQMLAEVNEEKNYYLLKELILTNFNSFPEIEVRGIFLFAINFCIKKRNSGVKKFTQEAFDLYKKGFDEKFFIEDGIINSHTFRNAISIALVLGKYLWVENFINEYGLYLDENIRDTNIKYNKARLFFGKRDYQKAMNLVSQYEFKDILINLSAKTMLIKMYYELSEFRTLESLLESMRAYIQRKKVIGYHKDLYKNIVKYTKKLLKVNPYSKAQKEKLKVEIEAAKPLTEKAWLLKQLAEL
ncbi:MAG: hypothetical protein AB8G86_04505 [Saprospiraceae bacterium]